MISGARNSSIGFPFIVEGKGKIRLGSGCTIGRRTSFKVGEGSQLLIGDKARIEGRVDVRIGKSGELVIGKQLKIEQGTRLFVNNKWQLADNVTIATNCSIFSRESGYTGRLIMNENSYIGDNCIIDIASDVVIGKNVAIGPNCTFYTHDHHYNDLSEPAWNGGIFAKPIEIKEDSWIGSNITILPGVTIGKHCVIAAGSVVTKDIPDFTVWAGIPAKQLKSIVETDVSKP